MELLIGLGVVVAGNTFALNIIKDMLVGMSFWKVPVLGFFIGLGIQLRICLSTKLASKPHHNIICTCL